MMAETEAEPAQDLVELAAFRDALEGGLSAVADLERTLQDLDMLLLTGRPHAIADATKAMELSLSTAEPAFDRVVLAMRAAGAPRLQDAARQFRRSDQASAAATADALRRALKRIVRRNDACHRRAHDLGRGLSASLRALHALGLAGNGRLIAEA